MTRQIDGEAARRGLEREFDVSLPPFRCGGGWTPQVRRLLAGLASRGLLAEAEIQEIKEKWGGLRFLARRRGGDEGAAWRDWRREKAAVEDSSYDVCELCGAPGALRKARMPYRTRCDACLAESGEAA